MNIPGFSPLLEKMTQFKSQLEEVKKTAVVQTVTVSVGADMVKVTANAQPEIIRIDIDPSVFSLNDKQMLEDLITAGVNQAIKKSQEHYQQELQRVVTQLGIPQIPGLDLSQFLK